MVSSAPTRPILAKPLPVERVESQPRAELPGLDGMRALAVAAVLFFHSFGGELRGIPALDAFFKVCHGGWCGVDLFFVLSGFLLTRIMLVTRSKPNFFKNFYGRRVLRIFPLYYTVLAVCALVWFLNGAINKPLAAQVAPWAACYGLNIFITLRHEYLPVLGLNLNHFWTLCIEEHFYLLWPIAVYMLRGRNLLIAALTLSAAVPLSRSLYLAATNDRIGAYVLTPFHMEGLLMGAALAYFLSQPAAREFITRHAAKLVALTAVPMVWLAFATAFDVENAIMCSVGFTLISCFFVSFLAFVVTTNVSSPVVRFLELPPLRLVGRHSYAMYVLHYQVLTLMFQYRIDDLVTKLTKSSTAGAVLGVGVGSILITLALSILSWHLLEKHFLRLKVFFK